MSGSEDDAQKTEEPTPRKLSEARNKGQVANSREVSNFAVLMDGTLAIAVVAPYMASEVGAALKGYVINADRIGISASNLGEVLQDTLFSVALAVAPIIALIMVLAVSAVVGQTGLIWTTDPLTPKLERISPLAGAKRLFSLKSVVELLKDIVKIALLAAIAYMLISPQIEEIEK